MSEPVVDIDSHVMERLDQMEQYLEPEFKDVALRIEKDERGLEYLRVEGRRPHNLLLREGRFGRMAAGESMEAKREKYLKPGAVSYEEGLRNVPAAHNPHERIKILDREGIDTSFMYPTLGLHWETDCKSPAIAAAYAQAYNNYIFDFCKPYPDRLMPIAHITLLDVQEGVKELRRTAGLGVKAALISGYPLNGRSYGDPYFDPFWAEARELGIPVTLHVVGGLYPFHNPNFANTTLNQLADSDVWFFVLIEPPGVHLGLGSMIAGRVFDRFPDLKIVLLETGSSWMLYWFDRMDHIVDAFAGTTDMQHYPSEYFKRQIWTSMDPDEELAPMVVQRFGAEKFMWGADFPHAEGQVDAVKSLRGSLNSLPADAQAKILGGNAVKLYKLDRH